jgi:hypothetical protein
VAVKLKCNFLNPAHAKVPKKVGVAVRITHLLTALLGSMTGVYERITSSCSAVGRKRSWVRLLGRLESEKGNSGEFSSLIFSRISCFCHTPPVSYPGVSRIPPQLSRGRDPSSGTKRASDRHKVVHSASGSVGLMLPTPHTPIKYIPNHTPRRNEAADSSR